MFRGQHEHTIDPKGRLSVPAKFRKAIADHFGGSPTLMVMPNREAGCLVVHPLTVWEEVEQKYSQKSLFDDDGEHFSRAFLSSAEEVDVDEAGRILLSTGLRQRGLLEKNVTLVGMQKKFEIWDRVRWEEYDRAAERRLGEIRSRVADRGV